MFSPPSKEALTALLEGDTGFREYLTSLSTDERNLVEHVFTSPEIFSNLIASFSPEQRDITLSLFTSFQDIPDKARELYNQCRFKEARELLLRSISLFDMTDGLPATALIKAADFVAQRTKVLFYDLLGDVEQTLGNTLTAGECFQKAFALARHCGDRDAEAKSCCGMGGYYWELGDYEKALDQCREALAILDGRDDRWYTAGKALNLLGLIHAELAQYGEALQYSEQALYMAEQEADQGFLAIALCNRATLLTQVGLPDEVKPLLDRALAHAVEQGAARQEALIRRNLGMYYLNVAPEESALEEAQTCFQEALGIALRIKGVSLEALSRNGLGHVFATKGDYAGAEEQFQQACRLFHSISAEADHAWSLVDLGNIYRFCLDMPEDALGCYAESMRLTEKIRSRLKRESHRIGLTDTNTAPYTQAITLLLELGRVDEAFAVLERSRSRALVELLAGQFAFDPADEAFRNTAESARRITELRRALDEIQKADETGLTDDECEITRRATMRAELQETLEQEELEFDTRSDDLRRIAPEKGDLVSIKTVEVASIQAILPPATAVLELYQTEDQLHMFIVRPDAPTQGVSLDLPAHDAGLLVFELLHNLRSPDTRNVRSHDYLRLIRQPCSLLHDIVFSPISEILKDIQRLIIVPHLFWHYLPFHALYDSESGSFLVDRFEITYAPSASALEICLGKRRHRRDSALILCRNDDGDLPHVEAEGEAISRVFERSATYCGHDAVLEKVTSCHHSPDVIHCACHGYFDPEQPFLSGITIPPDGETDRPTLLMDLLRLRLDSSLVTLSACDTGLNTISNADELVGLSRGFFGAGAASLLLSLWNVSDSSTVYLMENFYWHYAVNLQTKGRALQLAMQAVRAKQEYRHPYYWAPFVVMGEWI